MSPGVYMETPFEFALTLGKHPVCKLIMRYTQGEACRHPSEIQVDRALALFAWINKAHAASKVSTPSRAAHTHQT